MSITESSRRSPRRALAVALALSVVAGGLVFAPAAVDDASAATDSQNASKVLDSLNSYRKNAGVTGFSRNADLQAYARDIADYYAAHGEVSSLNPDTISPPPPGAQQTQSFLYRVTGGQTAAIASIAKKFRDFSKSRGSDAFLFDPALNYAAAGYAKKGNYTYSVILQTEYRAIPQTTAVPSIAGSKSVGRTLSVSVKGWKPAPVDPKYQWYADDVAIAGAKTGSLVVTSGLLGKRISVKYVSSPEGYLAGVRYSKKTSAIALGTIAAKKPVVSGSRVVGSTLTVTAGDWGNGVAYAYQWYRNGETIPGTTSSTYKVRSADKGKRVDARVLGTKTGYTSVKLFTATTVKTLSPFTPGTPKISGAGEKAGTKLSATIGSWTPSASSYAFRWKRDGANISKATSKSYTATSADVGHVITVTVTASRSGYKTVSATSAGRPLGSPAP